MMELNSKTKKRLSNQIWYHGTLMRYAESIIKNGIDVNYNAKNPLDFGPGFYLSDSPKEARKYVDGMLNTSIPDSIFYENTDPKKDAPCVIMVQTPNLVELCQSDNVNFGLFLKYDDDFANFVFNSRLHSATRQHQFDLIYGVETDSNPADLMTKYQRHLLTKDEVIEGFKKSTSAKQLYNGSELILPQLTISLYEDQQTL